MAKSKREKQVSLSKVKKKSGKEAKKNLVKEVKNCVDSYQNLFVYTARNMKSTKFIKVRQKFKINSRFFFGKNNVLAVALGRDPESAYAKGLNKISALLKGPCGLMFTDEDPEAVIKFFSRYKEPDFPCGGETVAKTIMLTKGPLPQFSFSMEPQLRKLGLPTKLEKGTVTLVSDFVICTEGNVLTVDQSRILKLLGEEISQFKVDLLACWNRDDGFKKLR